MSGQTPILSQGLRPGIPPGLNLDNIQGDIIIGLQKKKEALLLFQIRDPKAFRSKLPRIIPHVTTTTEVQAVENALSAYKSTPFSYYKKLLRIQGLNIAFTQTGLNALGITDNLGDTLFTPGQLADASALGDPGVPNVTPYQPANWLPVFKGVIHGVFIITGESITTINSVIKILEDIFDVHETDPVIVEVATLVGSVRPGAEAGHEHFGFQDGISQPALQGVGSPNPGQQEVKPGALLVGEAGDPIATRPSWAKDGSFLALRVLQQAVPEFDAFLKTNALNIAGFDKEAGAQLLGARLVGRWKSGAPVDITPLKDDPALAKDPLRNNNFDYADDSTEARCPYAAHIRKTNPRSDLPPNADAAHKITRQGIPYGPELSKSEKEKGVTEHERGLLFLAYQSDIPSGFHFLQQAWANVPGFPPNKPLTPGLDPIIGQGSSARQMEGTNPDAQDFELSLPAFVKSRGGQYFFVPSISALKSKFSS